MHQPRDEFVIFSFSIVVNALNQGRSTIAHSYYGYIYFTQGLITLLYQQRNLRGKTSPTTPNNISLTFRWNLWPKRRLTNKATLWHSKQELTLLLNFDTYTEEDCLLHLYDVIRADWLALADPEYFCPAGRAHPSRCRPAILQGNLLGIPDIYLASTLEAIRLHLNHPLLGFG
ncbi:hypothetical protein ES708_27508 [subsurface metagenome]